VVRRLFAAAADAAAALVLLLVGCAHNHPANPAPPATPATSRSTVSLLDLDGKPFDLWPVGHDPRRITVVLFTRTDCPVANRQAPEIAGLYDLDHPRGVDFYLIYVDPHETVDAIRQHLLDYHYPCRALRDPEHSLVAFCGATATPEAAVFDRQRNMVYRGRVTDQYVELGRAKPQATRHDLADAIESTLTGKPIANPRTKAVGCAIADVKD
jgi:hypothetical protein